MPTRAVPVCCGGLRAALIYQHAAAVIYQHAAAVIYQHAARTSYLRPGLRIWVRGKAPGRWLIIII